MPVQTLDRPPTVADVHREVLAARADIAELRAVVFVLVLVVAAAVVALDEPAPSAPEPPVLALAWPVEPQAGPDPVDCPSCGSTAVYVVRGRPVRCIRCGTRPAVTR